MATAVLKTSQRVHRVFHRLGVVIGGCLVAAGLLIGGNYALSWVNGPPSPEPAIELKPYDGVIIPFSPEEQAKADLEIAQTQAIRNARHRRHLHELGILSLAFIGAGLLAYAAIRALGWIAAGATRD